MTFTKYIIRPVNLMLLSKEIKHTGGNAIKTKMLVVKKITIAATCSETMGIERMLIVLVFFNVFLLINLRDSFSCPTPPGNEGRSEIPLKE